MNRDIVWHELYDAIGNDECPVCKLLKKNIDHFVSAFLYENVNDPKLRDQLKDSRGLCNTHAWLMQSYGDPLSHAIIYESLLRDMAEELNKKTLASGKKRKHDLLSRLEPKGDCMLCEMEAKYETTYLKALDEFIGSDDVFRGKFEESGFLCIPHLKRLIALNTNDSTIRMMQDINKSKYAVMISQLSEIRRKNDYRFSDEPWTPEERHAWGKAVGVMAGRKVY